MQMNNKSFQKLKNLWYKKLKSKGFIDIEDDKGRLKTYTGGQYLFPPTDVAVRPDSQAEYYRLARRFCHEKRFESDKHLKVWQLHSEGCSERKIAEVLKVSRKVIRTILRDLKQEFF